MSSRKDWLKEATKKKQLRHQAVEELLKSIKQKEDIYYGKTDKTKLQNDNQPGR